MYVWYIASVLHLYLHYAHERTMRIGQDSQLLLSLRPAHLETHAANPEVPLMCRVIVCCMRRWLLYLLLSSLVGLFLVYVRSNNSNNNNNKKDDSDI